MDDREVIMSGVREYAEGYDVLLATTTGAYVIGKLEREQPGYGRVVIVALNEAGHNRTEVDLLDLLAWVKSNRPELLG